MRMILAYIVAVLNNDTPLGTILPYFHLTLYTTTTTTTTTTIMADLFLHLVWSSVEKLKPGEHYLQPQKRNILHDFSAKLTINLDKNMWVTYWPPELMDFTCHRSISVFTRQRNISYRYILFIKMKISKLMNYSTDMCQSWQGATTTQYQKSLRPNLQYPTHPLQPVTIPSLGYIFVMPGSFCCVIG